jgi:hypothetical protein
MENHETNILTDDENCELNNKEKLNFLNEMLELGDNNNDEFDEENLKLIQKTNKKKFIPLSRITVNLPSLRQKSITPHLIIIAVVLFTLLCYKLKLKITIIPLIIIFTSLMILLIMEGNEKKCLYKKLNEEILRYFNLIKANKNIIKDDLNAPLLNI